MAQPLASLRNGVQIPAQAQNLGAETGGSLGVGLVGRFSRVNQPSCPGEIPCLKEKVVLSLAGARTHVHTHVLPGMHR